MEKCHDCLLPDDVDFLPCDWCLEEESKEKLSEQSTRRNIAEGDQ